MPCCPVTENSPSITRGSGSVSSTSEPPHERLTSVSLRMVKRIGVSWGAAQPHAVEIERGRRCIAVATWEAGRHAVWVGDDDVNGARGVRWRDQIERAGVISGGDGLTRDGDGRARLNADRLDRDRRTAGGRAGLRSHPQDGEGVRPTAICVGPGKHTGSPVGIDYHDVNRALGMGWCRDNDGRAAVHARVCRPAAERHPRAEIEAGAKQRHHCPARHCAARWRDGGYGDAARSGWRGRRCGDGDCLLQLVVIPAASRTPAIAASRTKLASMFTPSVYLRIESASWITRERTGCQNGYAP